MKKISLLLVLMLVVCMFTACAQPAAEAPAAEAPAAEEPAAEEPAEEPAAEEPAAEEPAAGPYKIAVSLVSYEYTFFALMADYCEANFPTDEVEVDCFDAGNDSATQNSQMEDFCTKGYDGIIYIPVTAEAGVTAVEYCNQQGVPIVTVDREVSDDYGVEIVAHVGTNHVDLGEASAKLLIQGLEAKYPDMEKWKVVILEGTQGSSSAMMRDEGMHNILDADSRIEIVGSFDGNYSTAEALPIAEDQITKFGTDIQAFLTSNDDMGLGVVQAVANANMEPGTYVIASIDGTTAYCEKIESGEAYGTANQYPAFMLRDGIDSLVKHLKGEEVEYYQYTEFDTWTLDNLYDYYKVNSF